MVVQNIVYWEWTMAQTNRNWIPTLLRKCREDRFNGTIHFKYEKGKLTKVWRQSRERVSRG